MNSLSNLPQRHRRTPLSFLAGVLGLGGPRAAKEAPPLWERPARRRNPSIEEAANEKRIRKGEVRIRNFARSKQGQQLSAARLRLRNHQDAIEISALG